VPTFSSTCGKTAGQCSSPRRRRTTSSTGRPSQREIAATGSCTPNHARAENGEITRHGQRIPPVALTARWSRRLQAVRAGAHPGEKAARNRLCGAAITSLSTESRSASAARPRRARGLSIRARRRRHQKTRRPRRMGMDEARARSKLSARRRLTVSVDAKCNSTSRPAHGRPPRAHPDSSLLGEGAELRVKS